MDNDRVLLVAYVTAVAAVIGTFVLWGPSVTTRPKKKGSVIGLQNLGLTCYLNSLLQAMASCRYFVDWLNTQENQGQVASSTKELLNVLCGRSTPLPENEYFVSPVDVVTALNHNGWKITNSQQDVHELLCNLVSILEEEAHRSCIDLVMAINVIKNEYSHSPNSNDYEVANYGVTNVVASHKRDLFANGNEILSNGNCCQNDTFVTSDRNHARVQEDRQSENDIRFRKRINIAIDRRKPFVAHDSNQSPRPSPFRGYLTNKLECTKCNYKSALRYDKFDSISLHLPERNDQGVFTLRQLLNNFVKDELISGITCEGCNKNRSPDNERLTAAAIKSSKFGKLPSCLCIHIVRTSFHEFGMYKRQDYVDFPEYIAMDPYLHKARKEDISTYKHDSNGISNGNAIGDGKKSFKSIWTKYLYCLKAVIVHRGSHNDGHFMTYRRGNPSSRTQHRGNESRWFLVSDTEVKETTLYNVLASVAYVLFYEKCP